MASEDDLAIAGYDSLTVEEINGKLSGLSQIDLAKVDSYERRHQDRTTILSRVSTLRGNEPWPGYDELTVAEVADGPGRSRRRTRRSDTHLRARSQEPRGRHEGAEREHSNA